MPNYKGFRVRITDNDKADMRRQYSDGERPENIAEVFGCSSTSVWSVVRGMTSKRKKDSLGLYRKRFQTLCDKDIGWVSGIIDGEGWIGLSSNVSFVAPRVSVASTDKFMAPELHKLLGGHVTEVKETRKNRRDQLRWDICTIPSVLAFCEVVGPHLRVKHFHAAIVEEYCSSRMNSKSKAYSKHEQALVRKLQALNKRGK